MSGIQHYENFPVASWLCPPRLRTAILALYHFARTADDLADEGLTDAATRLTQLAAFQSDLTRCLNDTAAASQQWPQLFSELSAAVRHHQLPAQPLFDLLDAFKQDVVYTRDGLTYNTTEEVLGYCRRSANPVGRLLLHLYGVHDALSYQQSDAICSSLQLINFWQDRVQDLGRGRDYLPRNSTWSEQLQLAGQLMAQGAPLVHRIPGRAGWELRLVVQGGMQILKKLERHHPTHDPALAPAAFLRPKIQLGDLLPIAWRAVWMPR